MQKSAKRKSRLIQNIKTATYKAGEVLNHLSPSLSTFIVQKPVEGMGAYTQLIHILSLS